MRARDIIAVLFCVGAVILASLNEAPVTIHPSFYIPYGDQSGRQFPRPILADLNGDGKVELLAVGPADTLSAYPTSSVRNWGDQNHFVKFTPLAASTHTSNIISVTVGAIDLKNESDSHAVAVVTDDYRVELLNNELRELWSASVIGDASAIAILPSYAAVTINSERIFNEDLGTVVVAMPISDENHVIACFDGATGELRWRRIERTNFDSASEAERNKAYDIDTFKFTAADIEKEAPQLTAALTTFPNLLHITLPHQADAHPWSVHMEAAHLFTQKSKKKRRQLQMLEDDKPAANQGKIQRGGQEPDDFDDEGVEAKRRYNKRRGIASTRDEDLDDIADYGDNLGKSVAQLKTSRRNAQKKRRPNNVLIVHLPEMILVLHYYTGRVLAVLDALKKGAVYEDLDNDGTIEEISLNMGGTVQRQFSHHGFEEVARCHATIHRNWPSMLDDFVEIPLCGHAQANFLERLSVPFTVHETATHAKEMGDRSKLHGYAGEQGANNREVSSALPIVLHSVTSSAPSSTSSSAKKGGPHTNSKVLFFLSTGEVAMVNGHQGAFHAAKLHSAMFEDLGSDKADAARKQFQKDHPNRRPMSPMERREQYRSAVRSQMQAFERHAQWNTDDTPLEMKPWVIPTPSEFHASAASSYETSADKFGHQDGLMKSYPHIVSYNFHTRYDALTPIRRSASSVAQHALAVGSDWMTLVNVHLGTAVTTAKVFETPVAPAVVVDFSGDGVNDIILPTTDGYYGYVVKRHAATSTVGTVMAVVLALFALLVGARFIETGMETEALMASGSNPANLGSTFGSNNNNNSDDGFGQQHQQVPPVQDTIARRLKSGKRSTD